MNKIITSILILILTVSNAVVQKVFSVNYHNQTDVKVFVVKYEYQADLKAYKVLYENQTGNNHGNCHFTKYEHQAKKKFNLFDHKNQADLKIVFVKYENQAECVNKKLNHIMYCSFKTKSAIKQV